MTSHASPTVGRRAGFTLVEIMVVMVIIGLLAAILVPVLGGILRRTNEAAVKVEISSLESALADFKARFGCDPPDHIHLYETAAGWRQNPEDRSKILAIWPRFRFNVDRPKLRSPYNTAAGEVQLSGAECLVFFLGGMPQGGDADFDKNGMFEPFEDRNLNGRLDEDFYMTGFSKNPLNPFAPITPGTDESRDGPFFDFPSARLIDIDVGPVGTQLGDLKDGFPEFKDSLNNQTAPYLYLSSSGGRGYDEHGGYVFFHPPEPQTNPPFVHSFFLNRVSPYRTTTGGPWWNAKSFQIISPGFGPHENASGKFCPYGIDLVYDPENTATLSEQDADNITNFSAGGRLRP